MKGFFVVDMNAYHVQAVSINTRPPIFSKKNNPIKKKGVFPLKMTIFPV